MPAKALGIVAVVWLGAAAARAVLNENEVPKGGARPANRHAQKVLQTLVPPTEVSTADRSDVQLRKDKLREIFAGFKDVDLKRHWERSNALELLSDEKLEAHLNIKLSIRAAVCAPDGFTRMCTSVVCVSASSPSVQEEAACSTNYTLNQIHSAQGPLMRFQLGQIVNVEIINETPSEAATIHFHGMHFPGTPYYDGASMVTQAPIPAGQSMTLRFLAYPAGTTFYHGHHSVDYMDGLRGIVIVDDPEATHYYDNAYDTTNELLFSEWIHQKGDDAWVQHVAQGGAAQAITGGFVPIEDRTEVMDGITPSLKWMTGIVNGQGLAPPKTPLTDADIMLTREVYGPEPSEYHVKVKQGETVRMRMVHGGFYWSYFFDIDQHDLVFVASSGTDMQPVVAHTTLMAPAERWDILVTADQPCGNYTMLWRSHIAAAAGGGKGPGGGYLPQSKGNFTAVLEYTDCVPGAPAMEKETSVADTLGAWHAPNNMFRSLAALADGGWRSTASTPGPPLKADRTIVYNVSFNLKDGGQGINWNFNDNLYRDPTVPMYKSKGRYGLHEEKSHMTTYYNIPLGEVVDLYIYIPERDIHSFHLHGYKFWIVEAGWTGLGEGSKRHDPSDTFNGSLPFQVPIGTNYVDPPYVDTFATTEYSYARIRFIADSPGMWHFHCHLNFHMMQGLQTVLNIGESSQPEPPSSWYKSASYKMDPAARA